MLILSLTAHQLNIDHRQINICCSLQYICVPALTLCGCSLFVCLQRSCLHFVRHYSHNYEFMQPDENPYEPSDMNNTETAREIECVNALLLEKKPLTVLERMRLEQKRHNAGSGKGSQAAAASAASDSASS